MLLHTQTLATINCLCAVVVSNHTYQHTQLCLLSANQHITVTISNALSPCLTKRVLQRTNIETERPELEFENDKLNEKFSFNNIVM